MIQMGTISATGQPTFLAGRSKTMRKIEKEMIDAIKALNSWQKDNTQVTVTSDPTCYKGHEINVYLHGNHIARLWYSNVAGIARDVRVSLAGWNTQTTRSRLSAIIGSFMRIGRWSDGAGVSTRKGQAYLHDANGKRKIDNDGWHVVQLGE